MTKGNVYICRLLTLDERILLLTMTLLVDTSVIFNGLLVLNDELS